MKLFIWHNPYAVCYGMSMLIVVAETLEQARELAKVGKSYRYGAEVEDEEFPHVELPPPTRIVALPSAEWHYWCE